MDDEWAIGVLEWWIDNAPRAVHAGYSFGSRGSDIDKLREREDQTRRVVARVLGAKSLPTLLRPLSSHVEILSGVDTCKYALGKLRTQAETRAKLGSSAPAMSADALHPLVWDAASGRWGAGHYSDAVQRAATFLNANVQDLTGRRDVSDSELMREAFSLSDPAPAKPRLWWPGDSADLTVKSMRVGILNMAQGVFSAIRNPATHSTDDMERQEALEQLATLSILARWIDRCELVRAES